MPDQAFDAYAARRYRSQLDFVDPARVAVFGQSMGAETAFRAVQHDPAAQFFAERFRAAVAYYPPCSGGKISDPWATDLLILAGKDDTWTPAELCVRSVAARAGQPRQATIKVYSGALHSFDLGYQPRVNVQGHMIGGNPEAAADSFAMTKAFLDARLKP